MTTMRVGRGGWFAGALALVIALLSACGDDAGASGGGASGTGATPVGEPCEQPGYTETGCTCTGADSGHRTCSATNVWNACSCRPRETACKQGDPVECMCAGESAPRMTTCLIGGTFDCPCPAPPDGTDGG